MKRYFFDAIDDLSGLRAVASEDEFGDYIKASDIQNPKLFDYTTLYPFAPYNWFAMDFNGRICCFEIEPREVDCNWWNRFDGNWHHMGIAPISWPRDAWKESKRKREE